MVLIATFSAATTAAPHGCSFGRSADLLAFDNGNKAASSAAISTIRQCPVSLPRLILCGLSKTNTNATAMNSTPLALRSAAEAFCNNSTMSCRIIIMLFDDVSCPYGENHILMANIDRDHRSLWRERILVGGEWMAAGCEVARIQRLQRAIRASSISQPYSTFTRRSCTTKRRSLLARQGTCRPDRTTLVAR
jgi:hypothetical protein